MRLVFASNNAHKLEEIRQILPADIEVLSLRSTGFEQDIDETGATLEENSLIKARTVWDYIQTQSIGGLSIDGVFADDTGLEIEALGWAPGVHTARWAGEPIDDAKNRKKALEELTGIDNRVACFRTVITLIRHGNVEQMEGRVRGTIAYAESGTGGFGYDALFIPDGYEQTFACLSAAQKNAVSHRAMAVAALCELLKNS